MKSFFRVIALFAALASPAHGLQKPSSSAFTPALKVRGGVSAGDAAHFGTLGLNAMVGVPATLAPEKFFEGNFPGDAWPTFWNKCSPEARNQLMIMTRFFGSAVSVVGVLQHFSRGVIDDSVYFSILAGSQIWFALLQFCFAAPISVAPKTNYIYGAINVVIAALAIMARTA
ncbi:hypothetical protein TrVE_jg7878 [Triparma verrucosa]|uniref:Uncharacterized protein n=2 Tax=Triparma TaxID=722752 RepID=A0A9W7AFA2_9STRA|nr:hypothetical protein TrST_g10729 [Triparma strigata]GMH86396.1 hypothetical protein TrVE_jg7878 [Triparma verrucosa]